MSLYSDAVVSLQTETARQQAELDTAQHTAARLNDVATRDAIRAWESAESPYKPVVEALAHHLQIGRESDGYPTLSIPDDIKKLLKASIAAGMAPRALYSDASGFETHPAPAKWDAHYAAWGTADSYRNAQLLDTL